MVNAVNSELSGTGLSPGRGHWVVFVGKTLYSHSASLYPGVLMGLSNLMLGNNPAMDYYLIQGEVEILLVTLCY